MMLDKGKISPIEVTFEEKRQRWGLLIGPFLFVLLWLTPFPHLSPQAHQLLAVLGLVIVFWVTEPIPLPVTALLGVALAIFIGIAPPDKVFGAFGSSILFLFIGSFILAKAMSIHGLDRRIAFSLLSIPGVGKSPIRILLMVGGTSAFISMWLSNTASTAIMLPIAMGVLAAMGVIAQTEGKTKILQPSYAAGMMLMIAYGASIGGIATPIGSPPNLMGIGYLSSLAQIKVTFFQWMIMGIPLLFLMFLVLSLIITRLHRAEKQNFKDMSEILATKKKELGPWSAGERNTLIVFLLAIILWTLPGFIALVWGTGSVPYKFFESRLNEGSVALLAAGLLFLLPINFKERQFTLTWNQGVRIDWGTILLFGGGLSLGKLMFDTGLATALGKGLSGMGGMENLWIITAVAILLGIIISETTSNTASAAMVVPLIIAIAQGAGVSPIPPTLGAILGASFGFMLPVSTPPNAIVYGSGLVPIQTMIRAGILFDLLGGITIWLGLRLICPLVGWV